MAWARIDDGFSEHPKTLALKGWGSELGVYMAALCYCARRRDPTITIPALRVIGAKPATAARMVELGLWDATPDGWVIHDWEEYQRVDVTAAERKRRQRSRDEAVT